jgi:hypothetical protein
MVRVAKRLGALKHPCRFVFESIVDPVGRNPMLIEIRFQIRKRQVGHNADKISDTDDRLRPLF